MKPLRYGLVGAGQFGSFCIEQYRQSKAIDVRAVADVNVELAEKTAKPLGIDVAKSVSELLKRDDIDLVHLATPPFTHKALVLDALAAGKHVLCEKPLATSVADAKEMLAAAEKAKRVLVVNLIMRYDPLNESIRRVLDQKLLGEPIAATLTNLAGDWKLPDTHWFWDREKSGGIFVEHSVHFFDLFAMFFGPAKVLSASEGRRPDNAKIVEQVLCASRHDNGVLATQYHGFHQPGVLDRQELRIICEKGDIRTLGWLTTDVVIDAVLDTQTASRVAACFENASVSATPLDSLDVLARHKRFHADARYTIKTPPGTEKQALYGEVIRALLEDQARYIADKSHKRLVTEANGLASLELAEAATKALG